MALVGDVTSMFDVHEYHDKHEDRQLYLKLGLHLDTCNQTASQRSQTNE
jgi:hypothetical protein